MAGTAASLFWIALRAVAAPVLAAPVPRRLISEVLLLRREARCARSALAAFVWWP